jgi:hypothetical protein
MISKECELVPMDRTLNPERGMFGMAWYVILGIVVLALVLFFLLSKVVGGLFAPAALFLGWWFTKDDPKEPHFLFHDLSLPAEFDPGKS